MSAGGRALNGLGVLPDYRIQSNSEYQQLYHRSQTVGDKFHGREGNSPDRQLRSLICAKWKRMWKRIDNQEVGLEAATL